MKDWTCSRENKGNNFYDFLSFSDYFLCFIFVRCNFSCYIVFGVAAVAVVVSLKVHHGL